MNKIGLTIAAHILFATLSFAQELVDVRDVINEDVFNQSARKSIDKINNYWASNTGYVAYYKEVLSHDIDVPETNPEKIKKKVTFAAGAYKFKGDGQRFIESVADCDYSQPFQGCMSGPYNVVEYQVVKDKLIVKITQKEQLVCATHPTTGQPVAPVDTHTETLGCKSGQTQNYRSYFIIGEDKTLICNFSSTCTHAKKQTSITAGGGYRAPGQKGFASNPYSPWIFTHVETLTYDLAEISRSLNLAGGAKDVAYLMIAANVNAIPTTSGAEPLMIRLEDFDNDALKYALYRTYFGTTDPQ